MYRFHLLHPPLLGVRSRLALMAVVVVIAVALAAMVPALRGGEETPQGSEQASPSVDWTPSYARDVAPIFQRTCVQCHGALRADKGLRLDSYQRMMAGDSYGTVVIPGDSSLSAIISIVKYGTMPHDAARLRATEIEVLSRWIDVGAPEN